MWQKAINFIADNWVGVVICMVIALFIFWSIGYFANGLFGARFELNSVWAGVTAITAAGVVGITKYWTDSKHNSTPGQMPIGGNDK